MNYIRSAGALLLPLVLGSCSELVVDTGEVCLVPKEIECECEFPVEGFSCSLDEGPLVEGQPILCTGTYPADQSYEIRAFLYEGGGGYSKKEKCKVEIDGSKLMVRGRFWHAPEQDAIVEPGAVASCEVGPLAAGTWTIEYGGRSIEVEIGDADTVQEMVCVESMDRHSR